MMRISRETTTDLCNSGGLGPLGGGDGIFFLKKFSPSQEPLENRESSGDSVHSEMRTGAEFCAILRHCCKYYLLNSGIQFSKLATENFDQPNPN